jgi:hypothetical protein
MPGAPCYFELHVRPMFRLIDRDHMSWFGDLFDYDFVKTNAPDILTHLKSTMPTPVSGGLWPDGWVAVFEAWMQGGFLKLSLTKGTYTARKLSNNSIQLNAIVKLVNANDGCWLDRLPSPAGSAEYILYYRAGQGGGAPTITIEELFDAPGPSAIFITDTDGRHQIPIN